MSASQSSINISELEIDGLRLRIANSIPASRTSLPLLIFNGIGANLEIFLPLIEKIPDIECIIFDVPGVGGSTTPLIPLRFKSLAALSLQVLDYFDYTEVDVLGVSWGGALAQEFAHQYPERCRKLILAATSPGTVMIPGKPSVLLKLTNPKRYFTERYLHSHAHMIYGGLFRDNPELADEYSSKIKPAGSKLGYYWQLAAGIGWTSIHWLHTLKQPTLILAGNDDPIIPLVNAKIMNFRIPNSQMVEIDCGHLFLFTMIDYVSMLILEFLTAPESD